MIKYNDFVNYGWLMREKIIPLTLEVNTVLGILSGITREILEKLSRDP